MEPHGFLQQALVYLAAGVIAVPLCKRLGLGSVLGYLVAGMAIGPWGLRLIADPQTVLQFSEFGVVLLLFLIGLELNPQRVWALRRTIFGLGGVQVVATIAAVAGIGVALGLPLAVSAIAGMGFAMSSTAIGLATLTEKNLLPTPGGQASFAVLLFQDLAVIPLLLVVGLLGGEAEMLKWADAAKALGMIALLIVAGRLLVRPVLRYVAETRLREVFVGFSLLLVLGTAALMEWVGLSMALGAFLAGVMLADSEYRHELELDIEPFKGLLLGLFFIAVGMSVDVGLFLRAPHLVLGLALGVVLLKAVILFPIAQAFGYCERADAGLFAVALSQAGEFAFVLFGAARPARVRRRGSRQAAARRHRRSRGRDADREARALALPAACAGRAGAQPHRRLRICRDGRPGSARGVRLGARRGSADPRNPGIQRQRRAAHRAALQGLRRAANRGELALPRRHQEAGRAYRARPPRYRRAPRRGSPLSAAG